MWWALQPDRRGPSPSWLFGFSKTVRFLSILTGCSLEFSDKRSFYLLPWHPIPSSIIIVHPKISIRRELNKKEAKIKQSLEGFGGGLKDRQLGHLNKICFPSLFI